MKAGLVWVQGLQSSTCLPLSTHFLKQSAIFIHHRKEGKCAWPTANLTPPLSQLHGKNRAVEAHPAPGTLALLYVSPNKSCHGWDRTFSSNFLCALTDSYLPLKTRAGQWGRRGQPCLQETWGPLVCRKGRRFLKEPSWVLRRRQFPFRNSVYRAAQNPHLRVLKTQRTQNFFSGLPPTGPSNNPQTAWISRYQRLTLWPLPSSKNKHKSPLDNIRMLFLS